MSNEQNEGRTGSFGTGARSVQFKSQQVGAGREGFHPVSVLDAGHVFKPANGMSAADRARSPMKGASHSVNGESRDTYDKRLWVGSPYRTFG